MPCRSGRDLFNQLSMIICDVDIAENEPSKFSLRDYESIWHGSIWQCQGSY